MERRVTICGRYLIGVGFFLLILANIISDPFLVNMDFTLGSISLIVGNCMLILSGDLVK